MARALSIARAVAAATAGLAVLLAATGWLYLVRPQAGLGGHRVGDALPLDELSHHSAVALPVFVAVWGSGALLLALLARWARTERLTAALLLALAVGLWGYLSTGVSLLIVRQVPAHDALHAASAIRAVWLPAALAGLAGALLGRTHTSARPRAPIVISAFVAATGLLGMLDTILPEHHETLLARLALERVHPITHALVAPVGLALVVVARGLARRKRRACLLALALLSPLAVLQLLHGFGTGAAASALIALALLARRRDFDAPGDPSARPRLLAAGALWLAAIYGYGAAAIWTNRLMADRPFTLGLAARETSAALAGLTLRGSAHLTGSFGAWFPLSVLLMSVAAAVSLLHGSLAPWRFRHRQETREHDLARALVAVWGVDTLAPFVLRADKSYFFSEDESAFLAYRVVGGVAIVSGDPIGPPRAFDELVARFIHHARERDWRIAILGASEAWLELYRRHGLHALYHGDEAVVETASFSLEGRPIRKVRQSIHRLQRAGFRCEVRDPRAVDSRLRAELQAVAREWRGREPERGFVMALDALFRLDDAVFVIGFGADERPKGFLHFAVSRPGAALSLSSMPRLRDTPNGFNEWLVCETVEWARAQGFERVSLNFSPFAALLAPEADLNALQRVERRALLSLKGHFQLDNLLLFNRKFFPSWERRFVVYERRRDLPRVGIAALAAEAYLPFSGRRP